MGQKDTLLFASFDNPVWSQSIFMSITNSFQNGNQEGFCMKHILSSGFNIHFQVHFQYLTDE